MPLLRLSCEAASDLFHFRALVSFKGQRGLILFDICALALGYLICLCNCISSSVQSFMMGIFFIF